MTEAERHRAANRAWLLIRRLRAAGIWLAVEGETLTASPASRLTGHDREQLAMHKGDVIGWLLDAHALALALPAAGGRSDCSSTRSAACPASPT